MSSALPEQVLRLRESRYALREVTLELMRFARCERSISRRRSTFT